MTSARSPSDEARSRGPSIQVCQSRSARAPRARWAMITMPIRAKARPAKNSLPITPPVKASGPVDAGEPGSLGRTNDSPRTVAPGSVVVVVEQDSPVHGAAVVVVVWATVVVVVQLGPVHGADVVVVVFGTVVGVDWQPLCAGLVLPMPLLPSHS